MKPWLLQHRSKNPDIFIIIRRLTICLSRVMSILTDAALISARKNHLLFWIGDAVSGLITIPGIGDPHPENLTENSSDLISVMDSVILQRQRKICFFITVKSINSMRSNSLFLIMI